MKQPFAVLGINPLITRREIEDAIEVYLSKILELNEAYIANSFKSIFSYSMKSFSNKKVEDLLSKRYVYGLDLSQDVLGKDEVKEFVKSLDKEKNEVDNVANGNNKRSDIRVEMYVISSFEIVEMKGKIERAKQAYKENPGDITPLMDVFVEIKYKEKIIEMANILAQNLSKHGIAYTEEEFKETLLNLEQYKRLEENYREIKTSKGREQYIPEEYIKSQMYRSDQLTTISPERVKTLLKREKEYADKHLEDILLVFEHPELEEEQEIARNQYHDYSWGIVLQKPTYMLRNEPVNTPIFKGTLSVELLGYISEKSLFIKRKYVQERQATIARSKTPKRKGIFSKLTMKKNELDRTSKTIRSYFYQNDPTKEIANKILRVRKQDNNGKISENIIFSPITYTGTERPEYLEFLKNVYFSDIVLGLARTNGGYAGSIEKAPPSSERKYFISNKFNQDEIASTILFDYGAPGTIVDKRDSKYSRRYEDATKKTFEDLLYSRVYERGREEYE